MKPIYYTDESGAYAGTFNMIEPYCPLTPTMHEEAPPEYGVSQIPFWNGEGWEIIPDYRFSALWAYPGEVFDVGAIRPGMTLSEIRATDIPPPDLYHKFDVKKGEWVPDAEKIAQRDLEDWQYQRAVALYAIEAPIQNHRDEISIGEPTTLTDEQYAALVGYRIALRKLSPLEPIPECPVSL